MITRKLEPAEISELEKNGCSAENWDLVRVSRGFVAGPNLRDSHFSGRVSLGILSGTVVGSSGLGEPSGITRSRLHNSTLDDGALVRDAVLANVDVGAKALIDGVGRIAADRRTAFGNGLPVNVLAEHGGRSVPLWRRLSSQLAHLLCHLRGSAEAEALLGILDADVDRLRSDRCLVGPGCRVERCGSLVNVRLEEGSIALGAPELSCCHLAGAPGAPARVLEGVAAQDAIFLAGSTAAGGVRLGRCLIGEGVELERGFSAEHSLFFANCAFAQGEAASAMCGPFVTSRHKATLVLACQASFSIFGSMANASNHHFKIGPVHGGVLRRGVKTGSGSYIFWPADIGAFSTLLGRHLSNLDTADFPFSLLIGDGERTTLVPGANAFGVGVRRDERKWPGRDRRAGIAVPLDVYALAAFSPFTLQSMDRGAAILAEAAKRGGDLEIGAVLVPQGRFASGQALYGAAGLLHTGRRCLEEARKRNGGNPPTAKELLALLSVPEEDGDDREWRDWGGLLVSGGDAERFFRDLLAGRLDSPEALEERFNRIGANYAAAEWRWLARRWRARRGEPTVDKLFRFLGELREAVLFRLERMNRDVMKEFDRGARCGFGLERAKDADFEQSRGASGDDPTLNEAKEDAGALLAAIGAILGNERVDF
ncbi:MAG: DUF4954 family protein [Planctomycetota bacterium]|jgi:hypothetical protein|nr:DUF4954 family protein [Planctomycetota bacterium]